MFSYRMTLIGLAVLVFSVQGFEDSAFGQGRKVLLTTKDHYQISGTLTEPSGQATASAVVLLHMFKQTKESWAPLLGPLAANGITSLAIDMRGHGDSRIGPDGSDNSIRMEGRDSSLFKLMSKDAEAAVRYLIDQGANVNRIGLVGASVGCSVALQVVAEGGVPIRAVVLMTPGTEYLGLRSLDDLRKWPARALPLLILSSREEAAKGALAIYQPRRDKGAELKLFDQQQIHGTYMFGEVDGMEELIATWLAAKLQGS